jgi:hypothetical protein
VTPPRRRPRGSYRPPRKRSEVVTAVAAVIGVLVVTAALIWFLRPSDSNSGSPSTPAPASLPGAPTPAPQSVPPGQSGAP